MTATSPTSLRVAQMIETMDMGGAENLAVRVANALAARGHQSHLIVLTEAGPLSPRIRPEVKVHYLGYRRASVRNPIAFVRSLLRGRQMLADLVGTLEIQVVQTHLPGPNFMGLMLTLGKVCPVLATVHNNMEFHYGDADNRVRAHFRKRAYQMILRRGAGTVAVSSEVRTNLIRTLGADEEQAGKIAVVTNGVEIPAALEPGRRRAIRDQIGLGPEIPLVLAAGRFSEQKNFRDLVTAAGILDRQGVSFQMVIAGEGEQRPELERQIRSLGLKEVIRLPGNLANLNEVMQAADLFCMSSLWEGLPLVLLEAMAAGLPTVGYRIPGLSELLGTGEAGVMATVGDPTQLAAGLAILLDDEDRRRACGQAARRLVETEFSFDRLVDKLLQLYRNAVPG